MIWCVKCSLGRFQVGFCFVSLDCFGFVLCYGFRCGLVLLGLSFYVFVFVSFVFRMLFL